MNVVYISTNSYIPFLGISLTSLLKNTSDIYTLDIYILSPDLSLDNQKKLSSLAKENQRNIYFKNIPIDISPFSASSNISGFHPIVLSRLLLTQYLPERLNTVLYLDCDILVTNSLSELEQIPLNNYAFAAVPELYMPAKQKKQLDLLPTDQYYNSGVLLINLDFWRKHQLTRKFINYYETSKNILLYPDQDILNHCCKGFIFPLSHKYNLAPVLHYFPRYFIKKYQSAYYCKNKNEYIKILKSPSIIHFLGDERPWLHGNHNPYRKLYNYYKSISLWKNEPLIYGKECYLFCYHILNCITKVCPWFRKIFTTYFGIHYYKLINKK